MTEPTTHPMTAPTTEPMPSTSGVAPGPGGSRTRWLVALGIAGVAIALAIAAILLLGGRQAPEALRFVPGDAIVVAELRLDLPGDQLQKVGNLLAHFPGFADQTTLPAKLDESLERIVAAVTDGEVSFREDLRPWVSGPTFAAMLSLGSNPSGAPSSGLVVATTDGSVSCDTAFEGRPLVAERHRGVTVQVVQAEDLACAVDGRHVVLGDTASVRAAIDAHADATAIDTRPAYGQARDALGGDRLATVWLDGAAIRDAVASRGVIGAPLPMTGTVPDWVIAGLRAEDDALVLDTVTAPLPAPTPGPSMRTLPPTRASELARLVPADAIAFAEVQGAGAGLVLGVDALRADPTFARPLAELEALMAALGGLDQLVGWVEDAGVVVLDDAFGEVVGDPAAGLLLLAPDDQTATARVAAYRSLLTLASLGGDLELRATTIGEVEVTTVVISDAGDLVPGAPSGGPVEVSFGASGRLVFVGSGEAFARRLVELGPDGPLAGTAAYRRAVENSLADPRVTVYGAAAPALALAESMLSAEELRRWQADFQPYLAPLEAVMVTLTDDPGGSRSRLVLTVTNP